MSHIDQSTIERQIAQWLEMLKRLLEENVTLKDRLSNIIIGHHHSKAGLEMLEAFQNSFVNKDAHIALLQQDINAQEKLAKTLLTESGTYYNFNNKQQKLQFDILMMEEQFYRLKAAFEAKLAAGALQISG